MLILQRAPIPGGDPSTSAPPEGAAAAETVPLAPQGIGQTRQELVGPAGAGTAVPGELHVLVRYASDSEPAEGIAVDLGPCDGRDLRLHAQRGVTDRHGEVRFRLCSGPWSLWLDRGLRQSVQIPAGGRISLELELAARFEVRGLVLDPDGVPCPGAEVRGFAPGHGRPRWTHFLAARADGAGRFRVRSLPSGSSLEAFSPGHGSSQRHVVATDGAPPEQEVVLRLSGSPRTITGTVQTALGAPVAGALLLLERIGVPEPMQPCGAAQADQIGAFRMDGLAEGPHLLSVRAAGHLLHRRTFDPERERHLTIVLTSGPRLSGTVTDTDRRPLAGSYLVVSGAEGAVAAYSDVNGRYAFDALPAGDLQAVAVHDGYGEARRSFPAPLRPEVRWDVELDARGTIRGNVVDANGAACAAHVVVALPTSGGMSAAAVTANDGSFEIRADRNATYRLFVQETRGGPSLDVQPPPEVRPDSGAVIQIVVPVFAPSSVDGRVRRRDGTPVAGAAVVLLAGRQAVTKVVTDAGGQFRLGPVRSGSYCLQVDPRDTELPGAIRVPCVLPPNDVCHLGDLMLSAAGMLTVQVHGPRAGVSVHVFRDGEWETHAMPVLDVRGGTRRAFLPGVYHVTIRGGRQLAVVRSSVVVLPDQETRCELMLRAGIQRHFRFELPDALEAADVSLLAGDGTVLYETRLERRRPMQRVTIVLAPGAYSVVLVGSDRSTRRTGFVVRDLEPQTDPIVIR